MTQDARQGTVSLRQSILSYAPSYSTYVRPARPVVNQAPGTAQKAAESLLGLSRLGQEVYRERINRDAAHQQAAAEARLSGLTYEEAHELVRKGEMHEYENPFFQAAFEKGLGRKAARELRRAFQEEVASGRVDPTDPSAVDAHFSEIRKAYVPEKASDFFIAGFDKDALRYREEAVDGSFQQLNERTKAETLDIARTELDTLVSEVAPEEAAEAIWGWKRDVRETLYLSPLEADTEILNWLSGQAQAGNRDLVNSVLSAQRVDKITGQEFPSFLENASTRKEAEQLAATADREHFNNFDKKVNESDQVVLDMKANNDPAYGYQWVKKRPEMWGGKDNPEFERALREGLAWDKAKEAEARRLAREAREGRDKEAELREAILDANGRINWIGDTTLRNDAIELFQEHHKKFLIDKFNSRLPAWQVDEHGARNVFGVPPDMVASYFGTVAQAEGNTVYPLLARPMSNTSEGLTTSMITAGKVPEDFLWVANVIRQLPVELRNSYISNASNREFWTNFNNAMDSNLDTSAALEFATIKRDQYNGYKPTSEARTRMERAKKDATNALVGKSVSRADVDRNQVARPFELFFEQFYAQNGDLELSQQMAEEKFNAEYVVVDKRYSLRVPPSIEQDRTFKKQFVSAVEDIQGQLEAANDLPEGSVTLQYDPRGKRYYAIAGSAAVPFQPGVFAVSEHSILMEAAESDSRNSVEKILSGAGEVLGKVGDHLAPPAPAVTDAASLKSANDDERERNRERLESSKYIPTY